MLKRKLILRKVGHAHRHHDLILCLILLVTDIKFAIFETINQFTVTHKFAGTLLVAVPERLLLSAHSAKKDRAFVEALLATNKQSIGSSQVSTGTPHCNAGQCSHSTCSGHRALP